ncbi:MAG: hypothetical protein WAO00_13290 [Chthoniobacterales bacterium]
MVKIHAAAESVARDIISSWKEPGLNHCVVVPPLNSSAALFALLRDARSTLVLPAQVSPAIAFCPYGLFSTADQLVDRICLEWGVQPQYPGDSYQARLESAVGCVAHAGRTPIILLPSFHETVFALPEELGSCLLALNEFASLRCVIEAPLSWEHMKVCLQARGFKGLVFSQFGKSYKNPRLAGYTRKEIGERLGAAGVSEKLQSIAHEITGGFTRWVDRLVDLAAAQRSPRAWIDPLLESIEFQEFLKYLDNKGSANRDALGRLHMRIGSSADLQAIQSHDWGNQLLAGDGTLRSAAIGTSAARHLGLHPTQTLEPVALRLIRGGNSAQAIEMIEQAGQEKSSLRTVWLIAQVLDRAQSGEDDWSRIVGWLDELHSRLPSPSLTHKAILADWRGFARAIQRCCAAHGNANPDVIGALCGRTGLPADALTALRLIELRLSMAERLPSFFLATTAILTIPEALLQLYCAVSLDLRFWEPPALDPSALAVINGAGLYTPFRWPSADRPLSVADLLALSWPRMQALNNPAARLVDDVKALDQLQQLFSQDRNPLAHHFTFSSKAQWNRYASTCRNLLLTVARILVPQLAPKDLPLPPLDALLDAPTAESFAPESLVAASPEGSDSSNPASTAKAVFGLSMLTQRTPFTGGLSGSTVHLVQFREQVGSPLRLGVLKVTTNRADFDRERDGLAKARECWLARHIPPDQRFGEQGDLGFILGLLAFRAESTLQIDNLHHLVMDGKSTRSIGACARLGQIYGALLTTCDMRAAAPRLHFGAIWAHWQQDAAGLGWGDWGLPDPGTMSFNDFDGPWRNPLACLDDHDAWISGHPMVLPWTWQHRDLNARNVLIDPQTTHGHGDADLRLIDLEKVSESSALLDLCWLSCWLLLAGAERAVVRETDWERLPDVFLTHSLERFVRNERRDPPDMGTFQLSLDCIAAAFDALRDSAEAIIPDRAVLREMAALTMAAAALAKAYYEVRDLQRKKEAGEPFGEPRWQSARCFFRISARSLRPFVASPRVPILLDLSQQCVLHDNR